MDIEQSLKKGQGLFTLNNNSIPFSFTNRMLFFSVGLDFIDDVGSPTKKKKKKKKKKDKS